jgi:hypothetical protein
VLEASPVRPLSVSEFFEALPIVLAPRLPILLRTFDHRRGRGRLIKFDYGHPETHFEVWHHVAAHRLEVGLHFEGAPRLNGTALGHFRGRLVEIKQSLPRAEMEPWDKGWTRLYETIPAATLNSELLDQAASLLTLYVCTLQPMLEAFWKEVDA